MENSNKPHRGSADAGKKKKLHANGHNAKAFAVAAPGKLERMARRSTEVREKKLHVPMVDRTPDEAPPIIVAVVGPPGTGKSLLIKSLVRKYTKQNLHDVRGPVTVVTGKRRRLTLIECNNDLNSMIDIAKVADLVLLMMDGNFGFEMETMEFLNVLASHGFPRILGITTHLDLFKNPSTMKTAKKALKHRFWTEVYQGAKLFYLSGVIHGRYPDREISNLARFISVMKFRPLKWRNEHPYVLADRVQDLTPEQEIEQNPKISRKVCVYGYVHGTPMPYRDGRVHIPGVGDLTVKDIERLPDPCPTPYAVKMEETGNPGKRRRLDDKQKLIYAPMSDVGGVLIDKDAVYIDLPHQSFVAGQEKGLGEKLVTSLQAASNTLGETTSSLQLFNSQMVHQKEDYGENEEEEMSNDYGRTTQRRANVAETRAINFDDDDDDDDQDQDEDNFDDDVQPRSYNESDNENEDVEFADSDSDLDYDSPQWKQGLQAAAAERFHNTKPQWDLSKLVYMNNIDPEDVIRRWKGEEPDEDISEDSDDDEGFFKKTSAIQQNGETAEESTTDLVTKWSQETNLRAIADRFFVGSRVPGDDEKRDEDGDLDMDEELDGDFEMLDEAGDNEEVNEEVNEMDNEEDKSDENQGETMEEEAASISDKRAANAAKKEKMRLEFEQEDGNDSGNELDDDVDKWYEREKSKMARQAEINEAEFSALDAATRDRVEGFRAGAYVRVVLDLVPCEFITHFDPTYPIVLGGLLTNEERFGFSQVRIKRHRWHKRILKTNDPLIVSLGWRRFQTVPIYTTSDSRTRNRMLKYTPEHMHCTASFYGPLVSPNTGFCCVQSVAQDQVSAGFRICATGTVLEIDQAVEIVKKLKLVGSPEKIFKNSAYIKGMFTSALEVARFEGAQIKTVSGIRGVIKRALSTPQGSFRASFEDRIKMSDLVILRAWHQIVPRKFYNPVTSLLLSRKDEWKGMRLTGQIRADMGRTLTSDPNSAYAKVERVERRFNPLRVPKSLQANLPYKTQLRQMKPQNKETYMQKRAVVLQGEEKRARDLMQKVFTLKNEKEAKRRAKKDSERKERAKKIAKIEEAKKTKAQREKKEYFASKRQKKVD